MSANPIAALATGHEEIDREHEVLLGLIKQLDQVCVLAARGAGCPECPTSQHQVCRSSLVIVLGKVLGFTVDHFAFEEKAMHALPVEALGSGYLEAHIRDHERIAFDLHRMAVSIESPDIIRSGIELQAVVRTWLEEHIMNFDVPLARLLQPAPEY